MGKRKLGDDSFFTCDYTGVPMQTQCCYMPTWKGGRLVKKGSYCCWEAVLSHAHDMKDPDFDKVQEYIHNLTGEISRFDKSTLTHFGGWMTVPDFCTALTACKTPIMATKLSPYKSLVLITPKDGQYHFEDYLPRPYMMQGPLHTIHSIYVTKGKQQKLRVMYWPINTGPVNEPASRFTGIQIHGDALIVSVKKELCFLPRERILSYTEWEGPIYDKMRTEFATYEAKITSDATAPSEHAQAAVMAPLSGHQLAEIAKQISCPSQTP